MKISDALVGAGFVGAGALVVAGTLHYPTLEGGHPGPALFPRILGVLMVAGGALLAIRGARARDVSEAVPWRRLHRSAGFVNALFVLVGATAYILLVDRLGFLITGTLLVGVLMWRLAVRPLTALVVSVAFVLFVHVLFARILRVPLPRGLLDW